MLKWLKSKRMMLLTGQISLLIVLLGSRFIPWLKLQNGIFDDTLHCFLSGLVKTGSILLLVVAIACQLWAAFLYKKQRHSEEN